MKYLIFLLLLAGAGWGGWWYYQKQQEAEKVQYLTTKVTRGSVTQAVTATGTINPVKNVQVGSQISGNIKELFADYNSPVKAGQIVAQLDPGTYLASYNQTQGELANAKATYDLAVLTAKRKKDLVAQNAAPQADLDSANAALSQAEAQVQIRTAQVQKAKVDLDRCTIFSPVDGTVITRSVDVGQTVAASMSAPVLFTIANDLTKMQINTNVAEADVGNVEDGQNVEFTVDAFPERTFQGKVFQVRNAATVVENVVTYDVVIEVNNEDMKLKPGMTANVSVIIKQKPDTLKVSNAALRYRPPAKVEEGPVASGSVAAAPSSGGGPPSGERRSGGGGGGGGGERRRGGGSGEGRKSKEGHKGEAESGPVERTLYMLKDGAPSPVTVQVGITDGVSTELLSGIEEDTDVVTGQTGGTAKAGGPQGSSSPFGGSPFRR